MRAHGKPGELHASSKVGLSRYFALYLAQIGWLALGGYLLSQAYWPSSCIPDDLIDIYRCSFALPTTRGWIEAALMTWLWSTPMLLALEISRRIEHYRAKRR